jgi:hypothetical protein
MFFCSGVTIMRLRKPRTVASTFILTFILGVAAWYILTQLRTEALAQQEKPVSLVQPEQSVQPFAEQKDEPAQFVRYGPLKGINGYANTESVTLLESPQRDAPVLAKVQTGSYRNAEILSSTRDFLRVRFAADPDLDKGNGGRDYEGWVAWGEVIPHATALVLDTATGEVVSRLALPNESEDGNPSYSVAFSPDGARAIFYAPWSRNGCEVSTGDYTLKSCLLMPDSLHLEAMFYGPVNGELYAASRVGSGPRLDENAKLSLLRVSRQETEEPARELSSAASGLAVSRAGRTGFMTHQAESEGGPSNIDVIDLETMQVRNTLAVESANALTWPGMIVINRDGSQLYTLETDEHNHHTVAVIDTRTGHRLRDLKLGIMEQGWEGLTTDSIVGDSLFFRVWNSRSEEESAPGGVWVDADGRAAAAPGIVYAIEAGDARFGVDEHGTRLFKLDEKNRIHQSFKIARPEFKYHQQIMENLGIYGMAASPDGKRLIIFVGPVDNC